MIPRLALAALLVAAVAPAAADPARPDRATQARADALFEKAVARYDAGDYAAAIPMLEDAYALVHDPVYLFNIAQSYRKTFDCERAADYYGRYLSEANNPPNRGKVQQWLKELEPCVAQRKDERARAEAVEQEAKARADEAARAATAAANASKPVVTPPVAKSFREVDAGARYRIAGLALGGAGVVALVVAGGYAHHGSSLESELAGSCDAGCDWDALAAKDRAGKRANTIAVATTIGGGVALLGGAALYFLAGSRTERVAVEPTRGGGVVSARVSF